MNLLPETWLAHDFHAAWVENLAEALERGGVPQCDNDSSHREQGRRAAGNPGLIWPVKNADGLFQARPTNRRPAKTKSADRSARKRHARAYR